MIENEVDVQDGVEPMDDERTGRVFRPLKEEEEEDCIERKGFRECMSYDSLVYAGRGGGGGGGGGGQEKVVVWSNSRRTSSDRVEDENFLPKPRFPSSSFYQRNRQLGPALRREFTTVSSIRRK